MKRSPNTPDARQRILETADRLFYSEGLQAVGVDRIIVEADVAKMTLYNHFGSKDELILAVLRERDKQVERFFREAIERYVSKGQDRIEAFFSTLRDWFKSQGFRGCIFMNSTIELADPSHPASKFVKDHKVRFSAFLEEILEESLGRSAKKMAPAIMLLVEGAILSAVVHGSVKSAEVARDAAMQLLGQQRPT